MAKKVETATAKFADAVEGRVTQSSENQGKDSRVEDLVKDGTEIKAS
jgi:hypothetical protein